MQIEAIQRGDAIVPLRNDRTLCVEEAHTSIMTGFRYVSGAGPEVGEWRDQAASALRALKDSGQQVLRTA